MMHGGAFGIRRTLPAEGKAEGLEACPLLLLGSFHPCHMNQPGLSPWRMSDHVGEGAESPALGANQPRPSSLARPAQT